MGSTSQSNPSSSGAIEAGPASSLSVHAEDVAGMTPEKHTASESTDTVQPLSPSVAEKEEHVAAPPRTATLHDIDLSYRAPPAIAWRSQPLRDGVPESWLVLLFAVAMGWLDNPIRGGALSRNVQQGLVAGCLGSQSRRSHAAAFWCCNEMALAKIRDLPGRSTRDPLHRVSRTPAMAFSTQRSRALEPPSRPTTGARSTLYGAAAEPK